MAEVISLNVGTPREADWAGIGRTAIDKHAVRGPVALGPLGFQGDQVADTRHHGGLDQAVYVFAREDLDWWSTELGREIRDGQFGENLTTRGVDVNEAEVGEHWAIGTAVLEVASVRIPCTDFKNWQRVNGYADRGWVRRFTQTHRPGPYLRVLQPGLVAEGDELVVAHRPGHGVTVTTMFRALTTDPGLLPTLLAVDGLVAQARRRAEQAVASALPAMP